MVRGKNRRGWLQKAFGLVPIRDSGKRCIWFHAVSVGEVNLLAPIIERIRRELPEWELVISTTTETGFDLATKKYSPHTVFFFPFDFSWAVRNAVRRIRPDLVVMAELEIWPNFISILARTSNQPPHNGRSRSSRGIPIAIINGRLSESSFRGYSRFRWLANRYFARLTLVAAQDETYAQRFIELGCDPDKVIVTGNIKYDGVQTDRNHPLSQRLRKLAAVEPNEIVFLAGSTQIEDEQVAARAWQDLSSTFPDLRLIIVPRHPERAESLVAELNQMGLSAVRRSSLDERTGMSLERTEGGKPVLLVDTVGELGGWWGVADIAFVGGSMGNRGGQNMLEPAAYGIPVSFGPNTWNFQTTVSVLLAAEGAVVVRNETELQNFMEHSIMDRDWAAQLGRRAQQEILRHQGAADKTVQLLKELVTDY